MYLIENNLGYSVSITERYKDQMAADFPVLIAKCCVGSSVLAGGDPGIPLADDPATQRDLQAIMVETQFATCM